MSQEDDEWKRAAAHGGTVARRRLLRSALIFAGGLAVAAAVGGALWWESYGSKQKIGQACTTSDGCQSGATCVEGRCYGRCDGARCDPGYACVDVTLARETRDRLESTPRYAGNADLCLPEEMAKKYLQGSPAPPPPWGR
jgi:hypothetical protein